MPQKKSFINTILDNVFHSYTQHWIGCMVAVGQLSAGRYDNIYALVLYGSGDRLAGLLLRHVVVETRNGCDKLCLVFNRLIRLSSLKTKTNAISGPKR